MKIYLIYESSKGRKDLELVTTDKNFAIRVSRNWKRLIPQFNYKVYEVEDGNLIDFARSTVKPVIINGIEQ